MNVVDKNAHMKESKERERESERLTAPKEGATGPPRKTLLAKLENADTVAANKKIIHSCFKSSQDDACGKKNHFINYFDLLSSWTAQPCVRATPSSPETDGC
jgi:hypothetical protein